MTLEEPSPYFSYLDEEQFFQGLENLPTVESFSGTPEGLDLVLRLPADEADVRDLLALLKRYDVCMAPLRKLIENDHGAWLRNHDAYWYDSLYGAAES